MKIGTQVWFKDSDGESWIGFVNNPDPDKPDKIYVTATDERTGGRMRRFWLSLEDINKSSYNNQGPNILTKNF